MPETNCCILLTDVTKTVETADGNLDVVKNISLEVPDRQALVIQGSSGSGKTTLLGLMAGLDQASSGEIILLGENLSDKSEEQRAKVRAGQVGFIFQSFQLVQGATALQNVMLPLELVGYDNVFDRATEHLVAVGLEPKMHTLVDHLSGGEQQRVAIARAFAVKPRVLFADEPTGNLDVRTGEQITDLMFRLRDESGTTLVLVTHEKALAERGDVIVQIESGRLLEQS